MARKDITDEQVCRAAQQWHAAPSADAFIVDILAKQTKQPDKVCYRAMERTHERGYIEYGVSLRTAWLTDKGKELIG